MISVLAQERLLGAALGAVFAGVYVFDQRKCICRSIAESQSQLFPQYQVEILTFFPRLIVCYPPPLIPIPVYVVGGREKLFLGFVLCGHLLQYYFVFELCPFKFIFLCITACMEERTHFSTSF